MRRPRIPSPIGRFAMVHGAIRTWKIRVMRIRQKILAAWAGHPMSHPRLDRNIDRPPSIAIATLELGPGSCLPSPCHPHLYV
jgi:hypothetical protein